MAGEFDAPPDGAAELEALLERSGAEYLREGPRFRLRLARGGCAWQTVCDCQGEQVLIYGIHPALAAQEVAALALCSQLNSRLTQGSFFLAEGRFVLRTTALLTERFEAQERIAGALEYNAAVLSAFWERLAAGGAGPPTDLLNPTGLRRGFGELGEYSSKQPFQ